MAAGRPANPVSLNNITIVELANKYRKFAEGYYRKNGEPTGSIPGIRVAVKLLREPYRTTLPTPRTTGQHVAA